MARHGGQPLEPEKGLAVLLVSGICSAHSLSSALPPPPPEHVAVVDGPRLSVMLSLDTDNNTGACPWLFFTSPELHWGQSEVTEAPLQVLLGPMGGPSRWLLCWWPPLLKRAHPSWCPVPSLSCLTASQSFPRCHL